MSDSQDRPTGAVPVERVRGERPPTGDGWRHDALAGSRHSRLLDELREPLEDHDPERSEALCAEITRTALGDFAPALLLLPAAKRRRARVLAAFALTLFDFALQRGLDGDRLAEINRWEFALERALDGDPAGQPIFVRMAEEERLAPWSRETLDRLFAAARGRALGRPGAKDADLEAVGDAFTEALVGKGVEPAAGVFAAALIHLRGQRDRGTPPSRQELGRISSGLDAGPGPLPEPWARAARFLQLAGLRLSKANRPLGFAARLTFLLRARLL